MLQMNSTHPPPPIDPRPTLTPLPPLIPGLPDSLLLTFLPILTYWIFSLLFHFLDTHDLLAKYRLHTPEEVLKRNHVTRAEVIKEVVIQQVIQVFVAWGLSVSEGVEMTGGEEEEILSLYGGFRSVEGSLAGVLRGYGIELGAVEDKVVKRVVSAGGGRILSILFRWLGLNMAVSGVAENGDIWRLGAVQLAYWYILPPMRMWLAIFILDTWQYFLHRLMHEVKWLYRTFHSRHHRLYVPYAFGALYNHPVEGLLMDTIGAGLAYKLSRLGTRGGMLFFTFSTMKTVDDHCGYSLPWDPLQLFFWNNAGYHDVHHQGWGIKTNFSQPFFICWDRWLGTQWTGGDVTARYAASRERAAVAIKAEHKEVNSKGYSTSADVNGPKANGNVNAFRQAEAARKWIEDMETTDDDGDGEVQLQMRREMEIAQVTTGRAVR
ncbi:Sphingolipid C4-hydroxylase sur2 [Rhizina undulata]